ncbi:MAG TPA: hypothetical protein VD866_03680 [Urbifossiella sp.]|nr:hypothetical protein [Urbifossiella sp.]
MANNDESDPFSALKLIVASGLAIVVLSVLGKEGCRNRNEPGTRSEFTSTDTAPTRVTPYTPANPEEAAAVEAIRGGGGSVNGSSQYIGVQMPPGLPSAAQLASLRVFKQPIDLSLRGSGVTDEDLAILAGLERVYELDLSGTSVTDEGIAYLRNMRGLHTLNLSGTLVTDNGLSVLGSLTGLKFLFVSNKAS